MRSLRSCLAFTLFVGTAAAQSNFDMRDPIFNTRYDVRKVHFANAPDSLAQRCPGEVRPDKYWLYAHWKEGDSEFLIVSSIATRFKKGIGIVIIEGRCIADDSSWVMTGDPPGNHEYNPEPYRGITIPVSARHGLAADFLRRSAEAFGGKEKYLKMIGKYHLRLGDPDLDFTPEMANEFEKFVRGR